MKNKRLDKFAVFIISNGRPDNVKTIDSLQRSGYTGRVYIVVDNMDETRDEYRRRFGFENVLEFDKQEIAKRIDTGDTTGNLRSTVFVRNALPELARQVGVDYYVQLDDDYTSFLYRYIRNGQVTSHTIRNFDKVVEAVLELLEATGALTVAFSQGGDHFGGILGNLSKGVLRKAMNSQFVRTDRPIGFIGRLNEDVNPYVLLGGRGELFFTIMNLQLNQVMTQKSSGGMTETYLESGTYLKSFFTVMMAPSCVKIRSMGRKERRLHHSITWENAVPKIIDQKYRKQ